MTSSWGRRPNEHVEDRSRAVDDRIVAVVAVGKHGVDCGDRPARLHVGAGAFDQIGQHRDGRGRIAARRGRLAERKADLATGMRDARQRIHDEEDFLALVAETLGNRSRAESAAVNPTASRLEWMPRLMQAHSPAESFRISVIPSASRTIAKSDSANNGSEVVLKL